MKKAKSKLAVLALSFLMLFGLAFPALGAEMPLMPMMIMGKVVDKNGSAVDEGTLKVFIGDKLVTEAPIYEGQVDVALDAQDNKNINPIDRSDLGKIIRFIAVIGGKEYDAATAEEIIYQELNPVGVDSRLLITTGAVSSGSGQQNSGNTGGTSGSQNAAQAPVAPVASPVTGTYAKGAKVELSSSTTQAVIYYTTDNTDPKSSATRKEYKGSITIEKDTVIKAVSNKSNLYSAVVTFNYKVNQPAQQVNNPPAQQGCQACGNSSVQLSDMQGHWAAAVIQKMVQRGVVSGYEDKTFRPDNQISRLECAAIIARALALNSGNAGDLAGFSDAADIPEWARKSVAATVYAGLLKGYPEAEGKIVFLPQKKITRVELASILARVVISKTGQQTAQKAEFTDSLEIPQWAAEAVDLAAWKGLVKGYPGGAFQPQKSVTRAEAAVMIDRLLDSIK